MPPFEQFAGRVYHTAQEIPRELFASAKALPLPTPRKVLLCNPQYFDVQDVKNVHMEGQTGKVDRTLAMRQWQSLRDVYQDLVQDGWLEEIIEIDPVPGLEDMVFTANQSFPWQKEGKDVVVMSQMRHPARALEVPHFESFYRLLGYQPLHLPTGSFFESMGDCIHANTPILLGGAGFRTDSAIYQSLAALLGVAILPLHLIDRRFYHLDTCLFLLPLKNKLVGFACKEAFSADSWEMLGQFCDELEVISVDEAANGFALNAHFIPHPYNEGGIAILQEGNTETNARLKAHGVEVVEVRTGEFMKSGGSVFCMKMMVW